VFVFFSLLTLIPAVTLDAHLSLWTGKEENEQKPRRLSPHIPWLRQGHLSALLLQPNC